MTGQRSVLKCLKLQSALEEGGGAGGRAKLVQMFDLFSVEGKCSEQDHPPLEYKVQANALTL